MLTSLLVISGFVKSGDENMSIVYKKRISPMDVAELYKAKGVKPSDVTVEEDGDEIRILIKSLELTVEDKMKLDEIVRAPKRI